MALVFTLPETAPFSEVRRRAAEQLQVLPTLDLRFWRWASRSSNVYRPAVPVLGETSLAVRAACRVERFGLGTRQAREPLLRARAAQPAWVHTLHAFSQSHLAANLPPRTLPAQALIRRGSSPPVVDLFLEQAPPGGHLPLYNPASDLLLFLKTYRGRDAAPLPTIEYSGHIVVPSDRPLAVSSTGGRSRSSPGLRTAASLRPALVPSPKALPLAVRLRTHEGWVPRLRSPCLVPCPA